jgi:hypothetical protein
MKFLFSIILAISLVTCKSNKSTTSSKAEIKSDSLSNTTSTDSTKNLCRFAVFFYSKGEGAEYKMITAFEDSIGSFAQKIGKTIDYKKTPWGREGETDFCIPLTGLTKEEQDEFILKSRNDLKKAKYVTIYENYPVPARGNRNR